jgi:magnesium transporter
MEGKLFLLDGTAVPSADANSVKAALADGKLLWLDIKPADPDGIAMLRDVFQLHPVAIQAVSDFGQRPRVEDFGNVLYQVAYGVTGTGTDADTAKDLTEVHIFVAADYLITIRQSHCDALDGLQGRLSEPGMLTPASMTPGVAGAGRGAATADRPLRLILLHHIVATLIDSFFAPLSDLDDQIDSLQEQIFTKTSNEQLAELFNLQRWLVGVRKVVSPQRDVLAALVSGMVELPGATPASDPYLRDLYDHTIRVNDAIDSYRDLLSNAMDAYLSMVSNNLNVVMKQLAIIATIFLPLSFLTGFFGQNFAWLVSHLGGLPTFLLVGIGTEVVAVGALYWLFRRRGWIGSGS